MSNSSAHGDKVVEAGADVAHYMSKIKYKDKITKLYYQDPISERINLKYKGG